MLSGFLLYRPWVRAKLTDRPAPPVGRYFRRRALRILPAYWFALTVLAIWPGITGVFSGDWWRYYFFLQLYDSDTLTRGIPVTWTLCVEVTFYLALPLWVIAMRRLSVRGEMLALGGLAAFGATIQIAAGREALDNLVAQSLLGQSTWFALGMALALVSAHGDRPRRFTHALGMHPALCWGGALVAYLALVVLRDQPNGFFGLLLEMQKQQPYPKLVADLLLTGLILVLLLARRSGTHRARCPSASSRGARSRSRADLLRRLPVAPDDRRAADPAGEPA